MLQQLTKNSVAASGVVDKEIVTLLLGSNEIGCKCTKFSIII